MSKIVSILVTIVIAWVGILSGISFPVKAEVLSEKDGDRELLIQDEESVSDTSSIGMFEIETHIGTQKVFGNAIPLTVTITPTIDSSKAQIVWDIPRTLETENDTEKWYTMVAGDSRSFSIDVTPSKSGRYVVVVDVTAWRYDTNYVGSSEIEIVIDDALHISPAQPEYQRDRLIFVIEIAIGTLVGGVLLYVLVKFVYEKYRRWISED